MLRLSDHTEGSCPLRWSGRRAIVILPEQVDVSTVGPIREQLLTVLNRGAALLVADMTRTWSLDYAGTEALARVYQRAVTCGTALRLVMTSPVVRRVLAIGGLDRLVPVYPTLEAALAAPVGAGTEPLVPAVRLAADDGLGQSTAQQVADALSDGIALTDDIGIVLLVNRRLEEMFGYERGTLPGLPLGALLPARATPATAQPATAQPATAQPATAQPVAGRRKDGTALRVRVRYIPLPATTGATGTPRFLAVIRDIADSLSRFSATSASATSASSQVSSHKCRRDLMAAVTG